MEQMMRAASFTKIPQLVMHGSWLAIYMQRLTAGSVSTNYDVECSLSCSSQDTSEPSLVMVKPRKAWILSPWYNWNTVESGVKHHSINYLVLQNFLNLTLWPTRQFRALPIQQQIKIWRHWYWQMGIQFSDWVENIVGKGEIASYEQISSFPTMFSKAAFCWCLKMSIYGVKGYM